MKESIKRLKEKLDQSSTGHLPLSLRVDLMKQIWKTIVPKLEVLSPDWTVFLKDTLISLYHTCSEETSYMELLLDFQDTFPEWQIQNEYSD